MKLDNTQTEQLEALSKQHDVPIDDINKLYDKISAVERVTKTKKEDRPKLIIRLLRAQLVRKNDSDSFGGTPVDVIIRIEMKEEPTEFKNKAGKRGFRSAVYCTADTGKEPLFAVMTMWNDANELNPQLVVGETYATRAVVNGNVLAMNKPEELKKVADKLPPMSDVITDSYPIVDMGDLDDNVSEDWNDLKLIKGVIAGAWSSENRNGNMMGYLKIIGEETDDVMVAKFSKMYEQVDMWDDGSLVYVLGQVTGTVYDDDSGEIIYEPSAWGSLIIPIDAFEKEIEEPEEPEDEDVDEDIDEDVGDEFGDGDDFDIDEDEDEDWG